MIHLVNKVYINYQFSPIGKESNINNIYIDGIGKYEFIEDTERYDSLESVYAQYGGHANLLRYLTSRNTKTILRLLPSDIVIMFGRHIKTIYPDITLEMFKRLIKLMIVNNKFVHSRISNYGDAVMDLRNISFPNDDTILEIFSTVNEPLSSSEKKLVSLEFLVANAIATNYESDNIYNIELLDRLSTVIWKSIAWDFVGIRRDILYGLYSIKENYGYDIDLEKDNIDSQISNYESEYLFNLDANASNVEYIKKNFRELINITKKHNDLIDDGEFSIGDIATSHFDDSGNIDLAAIKSIIDKDKTFPSSQIFGRTEFRMNMNNVFIGMIYSGNIDIQELRL